MNLKNSRFEWICKGTESTTQKFLRIFSQWCCIIFGFLGLLLMGYIPFLLIAIVCGAIWIVLSRRRRIEYEFNYFAGDLTIFRISNGTRRKQKFSCTLDEIKYLRKGQDEQTPTKKFFFDSDELYTMQVNNSLGNNVLHIETDERFVQLLDQEHKLRK